MRLARLLVLLTFAMLSCVDNVKPPVEGLPQHEEESGPIFIGKPPVIINEICSHNIDYADEFGENPGWVEFYNPADTAVNLNGYYLTNSLNMKRWVFGGAIAAPRSYLVVFMSGRNNPDHSPPRDSIDLIQGAAGAWDWADDRNAPYGRSTAEYYFVKNKSIGGKLITRNNAPKLDYSSAEVVLKLADWGDTAGIDLSAANEILFRGYVSRGSELKISLDGGEQSWPAVISGNGVENDYYSIGLPTVRRFPDLKNISAIRFSNTANFLGTIDFDFNSVTARRRGSDVHASFELSKSGGKLFLMDTSWNIRDSAAYPAEAAGLSWARDFESGAWALSKPPTPNAANLAEYYAGQVRPPTASSIPASGYFADTLKFTLPQIGDGVTLCCDTSGRLPTKDSKLRSGVKLNLTKTAVMRCAQFKDGAYPSEAITRTYVVV